MRTPKTFPIVDSLILAYIDDHKVKQAPIGEDAMFETPVVLFTHSSGAKFVCPIMPACSLNPLYMGDDHQVHLSTWSVGEHTRYGADHESVSAAVAAHLAGAAENEFCGTKDLKVVTKLSEIAEYITTDSWRLFHN